MDIVFAATGLIVLLLAGDALVRGAVNLGLRLGIPVLIVSLTVVAFGTSAPELLIAVQAVIKGLPGIAVGNVVGSNTANILMVMGFPALLFGINASQCDSRKTYGFMLGATVIFIALAFLGPLFCGIRQENSPSGYLVLFFGTDDDSVAHWFKVGSLFCGCGH